MSTSAAVSKTGTPTPEAESKKRAASTDDARDGGPLKKARTKAKSYSRSAIVKIVVDSEDEPFSVHENLLTEESSSMADLIKIPTEGGPKQLRLSGAPASAVEVLVDYLYHDNFALSATWEPTTTLDAFVHAWMLADKMDMEDAKNAIMDRLRFTVDKANTYELEGTSDVTLVLEAVELVQSMPTQPERWCPLYTFLIQRLTRDLCKAQAQFGASTSTHKEKSFQGILRKGGDIVVDVVDECFKARSFTHPGHQPDPAALTGCHFHQHTSGRQSRACADASGKESTVIEPDRDVSNGKSSSSEPSIRATKPVVPSTFTFGGSVSPSAFGFAFGSASVVGASPVEQKPLAGPFGFTPGSSVGPSAPGLFGKNLSNGPLFMNKAAK